MNYKIIAPLFRVAPESGTKKSYALNFGEFKTTIYQNYGLEDFISAEEYLFLGDASASEFRTFILCNSSIHYKNYNIKEFNLNFLMYFLRNVQFVIFML